MTLSDAIKVLRDHNYWRQGYEGYQPTEPKTLTAALDEALVWLEGIRDADEFIRKIAYTCGQLSKETPMNKQLQEALKEPIEFDFALGEENIFVKEPILKAASAYAELPEKLRGMKMDLRIKAGRESTIYRDGYNQAINDIIKEIEG